MRSALALELVLPLSLLAGCMSDVEFVARVTSLGDSADADATAAHRCADELRAVADHLPAVADGALELPSGALGPAGVPPISASARPAPLLAARAREELARREHAIEGNRRAIRSAQAVGPVALSSAIEAQRLARGTRERLCQARDVATTLAAMIEQRGASAGMVTLVR